MLRVPTKFSTSFSTPKVPSRNYAVGDNLLRGKAGSVSLRDTAGQSVPVPQLLKGKKVLKCERTDGTSVRASTLSEYCLIAPGCCGGSSRSIHSCLQRGNYILGLSLRLRILEARPYLH